MLAQVEQGSVAPLYFLHGEDYLVKSALAQLTEILVPESQQSTNLEVVDGNQSDFRQILDNVNTFALFGGRKVVVVRDCRVFYSRASLPTLYVKSKEALRFPVPPASAPSGSLFCRKPAFAIPGRQNSQQIATTIRFAL